LLCAIVTIGFGDLGRIERGTLAGPSTHSNDTRLSTGDDVTSLDLIRHMIERYVGLEPYEAIAATVWVAHAHVCDRFMVTPRLLLLSPVRECGKTTLLDILSRLVPRPEKSDHITPLRSTTPSTTATPC
jgi:hypothetical protein